MAINELIQKHILTECQRHWATLAALFKSGPPFGASPALHRTPLPPYGIHTVVNFNFTESNGSPVVLGRCTYVGGMRPFVADLKILIVALSQVVRTAIVEELCGVKL
jgi:hypothetical protein